MSLLLPSSSGGRSPEARPLHKRSFSFSPRKPYRPRRSSPRRTPRISPDKNDGPMNLAMQWMESSDCPTEVLPKILAFAGPQTVAALSQVNRHWKNVCFAESTWRILCEDLYKWSEGDAIPSSWRAYYQDNPCVPVDYPTIPAAFSIAEVPDSINPRVIEQRRSIRVLLRPGEYILREAIVIQAASNVDIAIETIKGVGLATTTTSTTTHGDHHNSNNSDAMMDVDSSTESPRKKLARKAASLRNRLTCRSVDNIHNRDLHHDLPEALEHPTIMEQRPSNYQHASLILRTRRHNEPIVRVRQGSLRLTNINLIHNSHGIDIWNGNAAVQIQPPSDTGSGTRPAAAWLEGVEVVSHSGRGIVNIDGGFCFLRKCLVHNCAATGIYVGGPGSQASIESSDVMYNGNGTRNRRGVGRGHSGIYLEQGKATIRDCNISRNSLTGISAVSRENSFLTLEASDLVANGAAQLETPRGWNWQPQTANVLSAEGSSRVRSGLLGELEHV